MFRSPRTCLGFVKELCYQSSLWGKPQRTQSKASGEGYSIALRIVNGNFWSRSWILHCTQTPIQVPIVSWERKYKQCMWLVRMPVTAKPLFLSKNPQKLKEYCSLFAETLSDHRSQALRNSSHSLSTGYFFYWIVFLDILYFSGQWLLLTTNPGTTSSMLLSSSHRPDCQGLLLLGLCQHPAFLAVVLQLRLHQERH